MNLYFEFYTKPFDQLVKADRDSTDEHLYTQRSRLSLHVPHADGDG